MNTVYIHIDERLTAKRMRELRSELAKLPHVTFVEYSARNPHDMLVEFEPHHNVPMRLMSRLERRGLHPDIMSC
jgi:hypothetical protein